MYDLGSKGTTIPARDWTGVFARDATPKCIESIDSYPSFDGRPSHCSTTGLTWPDLNPGASTRPTRPTRLLGRRSTPAPPPRTQTRPRTGSSPACTATRACVRVAWRAQFRERRASLLTQTQTQGGGQCTTLGHFSAGTASASVSGRREAQSNQHSQCSGSRWSVT